MTKSVIGERQPSSPYVETVDVLDTQVRGSGVRLGVCVEISGAGSGTYSDGIIWPTEAAVVLDLVISVNNGGSALTDGTATVEINAQGQSEFGTSDGWQAVMPALAWIDGQNPIFHTDVLGSAPIVTVTGTGTPRIRLVVGGTNTVSIRATVAPIAPNPGCP